MKWYVYIIRATNEMLYTGITTDLERRFNEHLDGKKGAKFFRINTPEAIVYHEEYENRSEASKREYKIKQLTRKQKLELISND